MFLFDWFYEILTSLGWRQKEAKILLLGLDADKTDLLRGIKHRKNAGKMTMTLFPQVDYERLFRYQPMQDSTSEELTIGKFKFKVFDLGGHRIARRVWEDYNAKVDAVVYVVEPTDLKRLAESKRELDALLSDESLANVPFLILANVFYYRISKELLLYRLGLTNFTTGKGMVNLGDTNVRPLEVFMYTLVQGYLDGFAWHSWYIDGFEWLSQYIK